MATWLQHIERWDGCKRCPLGDQRFKMCFGRSEWPPGTDFPNLHLPCDVLFVGEAPGANEDTAGLPFVGPAGRLLDQIIEQSLPQEVTYAMTNLVACFPRHAKERGDNEPERGEVLECRPRLVEFINLAQPRLIVQVGEMVYQYLNFNRSVPTVHIVHPAFILARLSPAAKPGAINKCVVQIRKACRDVLQSPRTPWQAWEIDSAEAQTERRQARQRRADPYGLRGGDEIPF